MFETLKDLLAVIGGVSLILSPLLMAWFKLQVHAAVPTAPAFIKLDDRVKGAEKWQEEHAENVKLIPQLAVILDRLESTLSRLQERLS